MTDLLIKGKGLLRKRVTGGKAYRGKWLQRKRVTEGKGYRGKGSQGEMRTKESIIITGKCIRADE